eukprot:SAG31_NODE_86_length_26973_cov_16.850897_18_plen_160_part_00
MDPKKVESIVKMPLPKASQTAVREFLGAASFYHDSNLHDTFHVSNLKPATDKTFSKLPQKQISLPTETDDEKEYEVERILDHRWDNRNKTWEYLIQWKNWSSMFENCWEPRAHLDNASHVRDDYDRKVGISIDKPTQRIQEGESSAKISKSRKKKRKSK